jgi:hypothetical protein
MLVEVCRPIESSPADAAAESVWSSVAVRPGERGRATDPATDSRAYADGDDGTVAALWFAQPAGIRAR